MYLVERRRDDSHKNARYVLMWIYGSVRLKQGAKQYPLRPRNTAGRYLSVTTVNIERYSDVPMIKAGTSGF